MRSWSESPSFCGSIGSRRLNRPGVFNPSLHRTAHNLSELLLGEINKKIDAWLALREAGHRWIGHIRANEESNQGPDAKFANILEGGSCFEALIANPNWIEYVKRYVDNDGLYIWNNFLSVAKKGNWVPLHSGGHNKSYRTSFVYHNDNFYCGNFNVLVELNDIGPGDGGTVIVPGSHKCNLINPLIYKEEDGKNKNIVEQTEMTPYLKARG